MKEIARIRKEEAALVVVDFQTKMMPWIDGEEQVVAESAKLIRGCRVLGLPVLATQQYTRGLGETVAPVLEALTEELGEWSPATEFSHVEKTSFSVMGEPEFARRLKETGKTDVILCGVEGHVCVRQSALDMLAAGYKVFLARDCVSSRKKRDLEPAMRELELAGATLITSEAALFEMLGGAGAPGFKQISKLVK
ncbi:MAG: isochorismatase family protein [Clostridiales Family XIII bacterium]|nr:isochorismatase family protein [Clostridiales Family XIII bacterium]